MDDDFADVDAAGVQLAWAATRYGVYRHSISFPPRPPWWHALLWWRR